MDAQQILWVLHVIAGVFIFSGVVFNAYQKDILATLWAFVAFMWYLNYTYLKVAQCGI